MLLCIVIDARPEKPFMEAPIHYYDYDYDYDPSKGHLRSPEVTNSHLRITFDQKEIETWDWCQYVRLGQANRVICIMTHFGHRVTLA